MNDANFKPNRHSFTELTPFRYWCTKILPLTYEDSLSYYELLSKVVDYLNKAMEDVDNLNTDMTALYKAYGELEDYVNNYFHNLDFQEEVNARLDEMAETGELDTVISNAIRAKMTEIDEYTARAIQEMNESADITLHQVQVESADTLRNVELTTNENIVEIRHEASKAIADVKSGVNIDAAPIVTNWLDSNISTPVEFMVDDSLTIVDACADAFATGDRTMGLANVVNMEMTGNLVRPDAVVEGYYNPSNNGKPAANISGQNYHRDPTYYVINDEEYFISSFTAFIVFYDKYFQVISASAETGNTAHAIPAGSRYLRWSGNILESALSVSRLFLRSTLSPEYDYTFDLKGYENKYTLYNKIFHVDKLEGNIFDRSLMETGYYDLSTGELHFSGDWLHNPLYYPIAYGQKIICNFRPFIHYYDEHKNYISGLQPTAQQILTPPNGTKYVRYSATENISILPAQNITIMDKSYQRFYNEPTAYVFGKIVDDYPVIIAKDGSGYDSHLLTGLFATNKNVLLKAGTYNVVSEYKSRFGDSIFSTIADNVDMKEFQYGLMLSERTLTFEPGAKLVCDLSNEPITVDGSHRFSAINLGANARLINANIDATGTFYVIHDDYGRTQESYTNEIINGVFTGTGIVNMNVIGGGCRPFSRNIVEGCYMTTERSGVDLIRYHNYNAVNSTPEVIVRNCYTNGGIKANSYGSQTVNKMTFKAYNNIGTVAKGIESAMYDADNVNLLAWNNTPVF